MKQLYEMTEEDLEKLLKACRPTPVMFLSGGRSMFGTPQENANNAWAELGNKMGFQWDTVESSSKGNRFFLAEPVHCASTASEENI